MSHNALISILVYAIAIPVVFAVVIILLYKIISLILIPVDWIQEAEKLNPDTFLKGKVFIQFEISATPPEKKTINKLSEVRCYNSDYVYIYKWISENDLIFIRKYSPKSIWSDFLNSIRNKIPELRTKNHVKFENDKGYITAKFIKGGITHQWAVVLFVPILAVLGLLYNFDSFQVFITLFFAVPISLFSYAAVNQFPKMHVKRGLKLITSQN